MRRDYFKIVCSGLLLAMCGMLSSCEDSQPEVITPKPQNVEVGIYAGGSQTRSVMLQNGLSAEWEAGDRLALWAVGSDGSYTLSNQVFKTYGLDGQRGFFTSVLDSEMPQDTYTYYCCYPVPVSVSGTSVTFEVPSEQDGKASGGADIMIATPVKHGALTPVPEVEDHSGMSMQMNRMMHQFRFWVPEAKTTLAEPLKEIIFTMPETVTGTVTADFTSPESGMTLSSGTSTVTMTLAEELSSAASLDEALFACAAICPSETVYTDSDYMNVTVYSQTYRSVLEPISLTGRQFVAGHSTPVMLMPQTSDEYYRLTLKVGDNYIGEPLVNVIILLDGTTTWYSYSNSIDEGYGNFVHSVEAYNDDGKAAYDTIISQIESGVATYTYETEHALVTRPITTDMMTYDGNRIVLELGDVPYLLEEDFSSALPSAHDDDYTASAESDRNYTGYLLNDCMPQTGWNAARYQIFEGDCIRINCRYQSGGFVPERVCGRLDTPALKYIKSDVTVNVQLDFDYAFYVPVGYRLDGTLDDSASEMAHYILATHTNAEDSAMDGENYGDIDSKSEVFSESVRYASGNVSNMYQASVTVSSAANDTRVVFWAGTDRNTSYIGANSIYYLYLDNIRIYINN